jgi:fructoselysine-6-P-deglycase FrlB-like protein
MSDATPDAFAADLARIPDVYDALADRLDAGTAFDWSSTVAATAERIVFTGMGSSTYAAGVAALRLRAAGQTAIAELASTAATWPIGPDTALVAISATGGSVETCTAVERAGGSHVALTNTPGSRITNSASSVVPMHAEPEPGGVACRTYRHTLVALAALEQHRTGIDLSLADRVRSAARRTARLIDTRSDWLPELVGLLDGPHGSFWLAPAERLGSAQQGSLMLRECPRRPAVGCETGEWSHVDVYLTRTLDYRCVLFGGSTWDEPAWRWLTERGATVVTVGASDPRAAGHVRFDDTDTAAGAALDDLDRLLVEPIVAELVAQSMWQAATAS